MYTWGYIKTASLVKLDLQPNDAIAQGLMNKFFVYANEALTQICSAVKPKYTYAKFKVVAKESLITYLNNKYDVEKGDVSFLLTSKYNISDLPENKQQYLAEYNQYTFTNELAKMPNDFISFVGYPSYVTNCGNQNEAHGEQYEVRGDKQIVFFEQGEYDIVYAARWFTFNPTTDDDVELDIPNDILDCLPSYIVSQCFKIDDEVKSAIYRNEYEMFLARINDAVYMNNETFKIGGGW